MPQLLDNLTYTWNNAGTTFTGIKYNVTDTASAAGSLLMDLQVGGVSRFKVTKTGGATFTGTVTGTSSFTSVGFTTNGDIIAGVNAGITGTSAGMFCLGLLIGANAPLTWTSTVFPTSYAPGDLTLFRDANDTLAQRRTTNAQTFRLYNTFTTSTDYQRLAVSSATATLTAMSGASVTATALIPAGAVVVGVTARVSTEITGATGFQIGILGALDRWADKTGVAVGTTTDNRDWTAGTIECFPAATDVIVTAKTSNFTAGAMRLVVHYIAGEAD